MDDIWTGGSQANIVQQNSLIAIGFAHAPTEMKSNLCTVLNTSFSSFEANNHFLNMGVIRRQDPSPRLVDLDGLGLDSRPHPLLY